MSTLILTTKFHIPPPRPENIPRQHLIEQLNDGITRKLTLISAPAGYGKTTLFSEWHAGIGKNMPIAWLSLDASDNDPERFWFYLISVLDTLQLGQVSQSLRMLDAPQLPLIETLLTILINDLSSFSQDFVLALDDVHVISSPEIHQGIIFLLEHLPQNMHLVILTRADPPLPLSQMRVRGQLSEIRSRDLSFNHEEATSFLNDAMKLDLSSKEVAALNERTEGWIAGLHLAALSMRGREDIKSFIAEFTGSHHYIADFLVEDVLKHQPESLQAFLLKTSILERMEATLCNALTGQSDGQTSLKALHQANLFIIPLDNEHRWYRYHHLFAELLRNRLRLTIPEEMPTLYHRAGEWFEENGNLVIAINNFITAEDFQHASELVNLGVHKIFQDQNLFQSYNHSLMLRWLESFPEEFLRTDPRLNLRYVHSAWRLGKRAGLEPYFQSAQEALDRLVAAGEIFSNSPEFLKLQSDIYEGRSLSVIYDGNPELAVELAEKALEICPPANLAALADIYIGLHLAYRESGRLGEAIEACKQTISISQKTESHSAMLDGLNGLGSLFYVQGDSRRAVQTYHQALQYVEERNLIWMAHVPLTYIKLSNLNYHRNDLAQAEEFLIKAIALCEQYGHSWVLSYGRIHLAQLRLAQGNNQAALEIIREVERTARQNQINAFKIEMEAHSASIHAGLGNFDVAAAWLENIDLRIGERIGGWQKIQGIQAAHVMVAMDRINEALEFLELLKTAAENSGHLTCQIDAMAIQAVAWQKKGDLHKAQETLIKALTLAASDGYFRVFLNEGPPMCELLKLVKPALKDKQLASCADQLLKAFLNSVPDLWTAQKSFRQTVIEQISERELEVLRLVAAGKSNQEIANELIIALGTTKRHIHNIYSKLDVRNRTECVNRARELNLID